LNGIKRATKQFIGQEAHGGRGGRRVG
jgi:hypothetical protein